MTMPAVFTFWQLPNEEDAFLRFLESTGNVMAVPDHWVKSREDMIPQPVRAFIACHDPAQMLLGLEEQLKKGVMIRPMQYKGEDGFMGPMPLKASVLIYTRPKLREGSLLGLSNLAAYWTCLDESQTTIIHKDSGFVKWGKKVFSWIRRHAPERHKRYPITKHGKEAVEGGKIQCVQY